SLIALALAGCGSQTAFPIRPEAAKARAGEVSKEVRVIPLSTADIAAYSTPRNLSGPRTTIPSAGHWQYRVGPADILSIVVYDHPELTAPAGPNQTPEKSGIRVDAQGYFYYPYIGRVRARGRTADQIRAELMQRLNKYIKDPQVEVRVVSYNAQSVSVTGQVTKPLREPLTDVPLTLLDAINGAGGLTKTADPRRVMVRRHGRRYIVDLQAFLDNGIGANNPTLVNGDVVSVPLIQPLDAYLMGQVIKPGTVDLTHENVTLTRALSEVGGLKLGAADARGIFVFRAAGPRIDVFQLNARNPAAFLIGTRFILHPNDVIYVTTAPLARWNRVISDILPSLTSVYYAKLNGL
ncbi:sugar ABC transporter substrate-binding protein, partial [Defluviimonas sp. 20V17]